MNEQQKSLIEGATILSIEQNNDILTITISKGEILISIDYTPVDFGINLDKPSFDIEYYDTQGNKV